MKGASAALRRFSALDGKARQALRHACDAAARDTLSQARAAVPVRSGRLRASLAVSSLENGMKVTASAPYAILIEQGGGRSPAQPYLQPAARRTDFPARALRALQEELP